MSLASAIQWYVDHNYISSERAQLLTPEQIQMLSINLIKRLITTPEYPFSIDYFLQDNLEPERKRRFIQVGSCLDEYVRLELISQDEVDCFSLQQCSQLGSFGVRDLLISHLVTIADVLSLNNQEIHNISKLSGLIINDVISVDNARLYSEEHANRLRLLYYMAKLSTINKEISFGHTFVFSAIGPWNDYFNEANETEATDKIRAFLNANDLNHMFTEPLNAITVAVSPSSRMCHLIFINKLTWQEWIALTARQNIKIDCDGVYDLFLHDHLTLNQVCALTQGQCYALEDEGIRGRVIRGELDLDDIPEAGLGEWHAQLEPINQPLNGAQSTHTASVHRTVSDSARRLFMRYGTQLESSNAEKWIAAIKNWVLELPSQGHTFQAAKRCILRIAQGNYHHTDPDSKVTTRQLLALSWLAIHDEHLRIGSLCDAQQQFCAGLYEIQREYNLSATGTDDGGEDDHVACFSGTFNKLMEKLMGVHPDVCIEFITSQTAAIKLQVIIRKEVARYLTPWTLNYFLNFPKQWQQLNEEGIESIWNNIKSTVSKCVFEEFHSLFDSKESIKFTDFIDGGQYLQIDNSSSFHRMLMQSEGYKDYCRHVIRDNDVLCGRFFDDSTNKRRSHERQQSVGKACQMRLFSDRSNRQPEAENSERLVVFRK